MLFPAIAGLVFTCLMTVDRVLTLLMTGLIWRADSMIASIGVTASKAELLSLPVTVPVRLPLSRSSTPPPLGAPTQPCFCQWQHALVSLAEAQIEDLCAQACGDSASAETISSHAERFPSVCDARALTNCSLFALDAGDFHKAADQYPGVKSKLQAWAIR